MNSIAIKLFLFRDIDQTISSFVSILSEVYPGLAFDFNNYSPVLPHLTLMLETIAISGLPIKERSKTYYELEVNSDVTDLIACCNALNLQKLLSADILELKSKKHKQTRSKAY